MPFTEVVDPHTFDWRRIRPGRFMIDEEFVRRAKHLDPTERALFDLILVHNTSHRQVGALVGVSAGTISRRVRKIKNRLYDRTTVFLTLDRLLPEEMKQVGLDHYLRGNSVKQISLKRKISDAQVRGILIACRELARRLPIRRLAAEDMTSTPNRK